MRSRLSLMALATTSLVVIAFILPLALLVRTVAADRALNQARVEAYGLVPVLATVRDPDTIERIVSDSNAASERDISIFLADGRALGAPAAMDQTVELARRGAAFTATVPGGAAVLVPVVVPGGGTDVIRIFVPDAALERGVVAAWAMLGGLGVVLILVALAVADRLARSISAPILALANAARRLAQRDLTFRAAPDGPPEVADVARALNALAARIEELLRVEREKASDLAHRLRTPLAALRLEVDMLDDAKTAAPVVRSVDELTRAIDQLIREARQPLHEGVAPTSDLGEVVAERVAFWAALADDQERQYALELAPGPLPVRVQRADLAAAVDALLGNVLAHTPEGTAFRVSAEWREGGARLVVEDDGPGFSTAAGADRGTRAGMTGLGIDIARRTAERSGGRLVIARAASGGARIVMDLAAPPAVTTIAP